jgi:hypothetical protein
MNSIDHQTFGGHLFFLFVEAVGFVEVVELVLLIPFQRFLLFLLYLFSHVVAATFIKTIIQSINRVSGDKKTICEDSLPPLTRLSAFFGLFL